MTTATASKVLRAAPGSSLTLAEMRQSLPSIFAHAPHASRSDKYVYISTEDMLARLVDGGFQPVEARAATSRDAGRRPYAKHMLRFRSADELAKPENMWLANRRGDGLGVAYEVILRNAHDGSGSYQMVAGLIRFACENGLVISDGTVASIKVLHTGNRERLLNTVLASANTVLEQGPQVGKRIRAWRQIELREAERLAFAKAAHKVRFADQDGAITSAIKPEQLIVPRRITDAGKSLWEVFNVAQENCLRGGLAATGVDGAGRVRRFTARAINGIDQDLRLNRQLWALAERAAKLKDAGKPALELEAA